MRYLVAALILFAVYSAQSQTYEIGGMVGGSNYIGDIGPTTYINPNDVAFGGFLRWNRSARHSFRLSALYMPLQSDDAKSKELRREERGYSFKNNVKEFSLGLEYTFWEFDLHRPKSQATPYLYTGLTYFNYNNLYRDNLRNQVKKNGTDWEFAIPMVVGFKTTVGSKMVLGFEIGARYTLTDNLDGSNPLGDVAENSENLKFGNINNDDWYVFTGIILSFTFGNKPCYCVF